MHEYRERVVNHRFVVNRKELLDGWDGNRIEASSASACKNNSFHVIEEKNGLLYKLCCFGGVWLCPVATFREN